MPTVVQPCTCIDVMMASKTDSDFVGRASALLGGGGGGHCPPPKLNASLRKARSTNVVSSDERCPVSLALSPLPASFCTR